MESILTSIKKLLGIAADYEQFDTDIIIHINSAFSTLTQLGVGPSGGFVIQDETSTWSDFTADDPKLEFVKTYIYLKVRLVCDPPTTGSVIEAIKQNISEYEWRLMIAADQVKSTGEEENQNGE